LGQIRGYLSRKKFFIIKSYLELSHQEEIENLENQYKFQNLIISEYARKIPYSKNGWEKFYPLEEKRFKKEYGFILNTILIHINNREIYSGTINIKNKRHGFGTTILNDGKKYTGFWEDDYFEGWGEFIDRKGNIFHGVFNKGILNGKGEKFSSNGNYYEGDFKDGIRNGLGREETKEHIYIGNYENDKKNKIGKLTYKNKNESYEGEFLDNNITGKGKYINEDGDEYDGDFLNGKMNGIGIYKWSDGSEYEGEYIENIKEGRGKFIWADGKIFEGKFFDGKILA
jgi:hypothetical protein